MAEGTDSVPESGRSITFEDVLAGVATPSEYYDDWNSGMGEDPGSRASAGGVQTMATTGASTMTLTEGTYYLNNRYCGKYLRYNESVLSPQSGLISMLGDTIRWKVEAVSGGYVFRAENDPTKYLGVPIDTSSTAVEVVTSTLATPPSRCIWVVYLADCGGGLLYNTYNSKYLYSYGSTLYTTASTGTANTSAYFSCAWRLATVDYYGNTSSHSNRELTSIYSGRNFIVNVSETKSATVAKEPYNALWVNAWDFTYSYVSGTNGCASFAYATGVGRGIKPGIATFKITHKVTGRTGTMTVYVDRFTYELVNEFGFADSDALLIRNLYDRVSEKYPNDDYLNHAWMCARILGGMCYGEEGIIDQITWADVAGGYQYYSELAFFTEELDYTASEYEAILTCIVDQHGEAGANSSMGDFAHMQISLAARLAYYLDLDGALANIVYSYTDEELSYLAGWLGDATLGNPTSFNNDDYCADLDAENIYRLIIGGKTIIAATNQYYAGLTSANTRADVFMTYIDYETIESQIFDKLTDVDSSMEVLKAKHPDTYNFLQSIQAGLSEMGNYVE